MEKIAVHLYGGKGIFGGKEKPLEADIIYCDRAKECSCYQNGKCFQIRAPFFGGCKFGKTETVKGYTSRAGKYYEFKNRYTGDPLYGKLSFPNTLAAMMGDHLFMKTGLVNVRKRCDRDEVWRKDICGYMIEDPGFGGCCVFLPVEDATNELLKAIFSFTPHSIMGDNLGKRWKGELVPQILQDLKICAPDIYHRFTTEYPEFIYEPNYKGKSIYVNSLKPGTMFTQKNVSWMYDGEYVVSEKPVGLGFTSPWWNQGGNSSILKIKVTDQMTITVESNDIIDEGVRFV